MGTFLRWSCLVLAVLLSAYGLLYLQNNRPAPPPSAAVIDASWERSVQWLESHRGQILRNFNQMLWWMVGESAHLTGDARLHALSREFRDTYARQMPNDIWQVFFTPERFRGAAIPASRYREFPDYQQFFLYTLACSPRLAGDPVVVAQNDPDFCWQGTRSLRPACTTHQLMGFRFAQRNHCGFSELDGGVAQLQGAIRRQLTLDPRVVDVYLQRVTMLLDSGDRQGVNPRWLQRILAAQLPDGSWADVHPLVPVGDGRYLNFTSRGFSVGARQGTFHATAQGLWLMSLLRDRAQPAPRSP